MVFRPPLTILVLGYLPMTTRRTALPPESEPCVSVYMDLGSKATVVLVHWSMSFGSATSRASWNTRMDGPVAGSKETMASHVRPNPPATQAVPGPTGATARDGGAGGVSSPRV